MIDPDIEVVNKYTYKDFERKLVGINDAISVIENGDRIWAGGLNAVPTEFLVELCKRKENLNRVTVISGLILYPFDFLNKDYKGHIDYVSFFLSLFEKKARINGNVSPHSYNLSEIAQAIKGVHKPNVIAITVTEPDDEGFMSMGPSGGVGNNASLEMADKVILCVNKSLPRVKGKCNSVHVSQATHIVYTDAKIPLLPEAPANETANRIADHIVPMIKDGDTLQIGIGAIPNTVGYRLDSKKDLGVHTEMLTDCIVYLAKKGVITGKCKNFNTGKIVFSFAAGSKDLLDYLDNNDDVMVVPIEETNDCRIAGTNDNYVSINTCLMVDLTGQISSESVGFSQISGTGGQLDLVRGAKFSKGGRSFIGMNSTRMIDGKIQSNIVLNFPPGTAVTTPRSDAHFIVTEYGIVNMRHQSLETRVRSLISIAHPDFRDELLQKAIDVGLLTP
ncbi:MAG: hypothetical protein K6L74_14305 [Neptuniibacter sp.]